MFAFARRIVASIASCGIGALALLAVPTGASAQVANWQPVSIPSCNATSLAQIPGTVDMFIGRRLINTSGDACSGSSWNLVLYRFDWASQSFAFIKNVVSPGGSGIRLTAQPGTVVTTAYDGTVADVNGQLWVTFECAGSGGALSSGSASSCLAPLSRGDYTVDLSRMNVVVSAVASAEPTPGRSASVPKIFVYQGSPYIYWTAVEFRRPPGGGDVTSRIATRGAQLAANASGMLWVAGRQSALPADQGDEVLGSSADGLVGDLADGFDVQVIDGRLLMTSGAGTTGCYSPLAPMFGCYRLQIRTAATPLGNHVYNGAVVNNAKLPFNPHEYGRFAKDPAGNWQIFGGFLNPVATGSAAPAETVSPAIGHFPVIPSSFQFGTSDGTPQADPTSGPNVLNLPFATLRALNLSCNPASPRPGDSGNSCASSTARYCTSQGYAAGGIMEEYTSQDTSLLCLRAEHANAPVISIAELTGRNGNCQAGNLFSDSCASAIASYCTSIGYPGGGFGPLEYNDGAAQITCMDALAGDVVHTTFTELSSYSSCSASGTTTGPCFSAVNRLCVAKGYRAGYGILDHAGNAANIGCAKGNVPR